jgi:hypothetical protein
LNPDKDLINRGAIVEAFVGQELIAYSSPKSRRDLYFWKRESRGALAEVDYLYDFENAVLPVEVKSGHGSTLRSLHQFLEEHKKSKMGMRFWSENYSVMNKIDSRPLYAVATLAHEDQTKALSSLYTQVLLRRDLAIFLFKMKVFDMFFASEVIPERSMYHVRRNYSLLSRSCCSDVTYCPFARSSRSG